MKPAPRTGVRLVLYLAAVPPLVWGAACADIKPVAAIFVLDCSASARHLRGRAVELVLEVGRSLDPTRDRMAILRLADDVVPLLPRSRPSLRTMAAALERYSGLDARDGLGTAYGEALRAAINEAEAARREGFRSTVVVLGDGANEPTRGEPAGRKASALATASRAVTRSQVPLALLLLSPRALAHFEPLWRGLPGDRVLARTDAAPVSEVALDLLQLIGR